MGSNIITRVKYSRKYEENKIHGITIHSTIIYTEDISLWDIHVNG